MCFAALFVRAQLRLDTTLNDAAPAMVDGAPAESMRMPLPRKGRGSKGKIVMVHFMYLLAYDLGSEQGGRVRGLGGRIGGRRLVSMRLSVCCACPVLAVALSLWWAVGTSSGRCEGEGWAEIRGLRTGSAPGGEL